MQIKNEKEWKQGDRLTLGVQTNPGNTVAQAYWLARRWAPKNAKSFTFVKFQHTDYHGHPKDEETGYADVEIKYYTSLKEGDHLVKPARNMVVVMLELDDNMGSAPMSHVATWLGCINGIKDVTAWRAFTKDPVQVWTAMGELLIQKAED